MQCVCRSTDRQKLTKPFFETMAGCLNHRCSVNLKNGIEILSLKFTSPTRKQTNRPQKTSLYVDKANSPEKLLMDVHMHAAEKSLSVI